MQTCEVHRARVGAAPESMQKLLWSHAAADLRPLGLKAVWAQSASVFNSLEVLTKEPAECARGRARACTGIRNQDRPEPCWGLCPSAVQEPCIQGGANYGS